ncbi:MULTISPECIES: diaminopimelate epimerase [unclassified Crossiella]|uniref:diaminopimelate epimerase n=1 Tax=unclassified Crossiella TaxID=2620835 RepID=UPI0020001304|nr:MULTISPECIES: diaminopimelate epimerase [unclassified Crossiella]MCK2240249.1 diaminopimelate epimerase [Crossiella sp. S99.2]MCK2253299.1 diaminopimelate epimerase [Crossiella sp. S99.1]
MAGVEFLKGHGTENDFVLLPDADGELDLTDALVRALCDRQRGLGADGVLRVVRTAKLTDAPAGVESAEWFMDYRNADGSIAEMCGNGVRVFAHYLVRQGLAQAGEFPVGTRAGIRPVIAHADGTVTVDMGPVTVFGRSTATLGGREYPGVAVDVGNPHLVCPLDGGLEDLDLTSQPGYDPAVFPRGVNIEFVRTLAPGALRMRVHERGVGETRSCGTGTVATAAAALHLTGHNTGEVTVDILGGQVRVTVEDQRATLTGPAVLVASGRLDQSWWDSFRAS